MSIRARDTYSTDSDLNYESSFDNTPPSRWQDVKTFLYDPKTRTCCSRTPKQWFIMIIYYIIYTTFIVLLYLGFLLGCLAVVKLTNPTIPIIDKETLIEENNPGFGFVPNIVHTKYPIIWYSPDPSEEKTQVEYVEELDKFFKKYKTANLQDYVDCETDSNRQKPCYFDVNRLGDCSQRGYQYTNSSLCFFLKLNKLRNWSPAYYRDEQDMPDGMSQSLIDKIMSDDEKEIIYVECLGENLWDNQHLGEMTYFPQQGFDGYFFPYQEKRHYLSPLVAVKLNNVTTGVLIHIKCTVWVKNIGPRRNHLLLKVFIDNTLPY